jgi:hypothetical protein
MAFKNDVSRLVHLHGWCSPAQLRKLARRRKALIISDCEGFEVELFIPEVVGDLDRSDLIVELHCRKGVDVKHVLCERLAASHDIEIIPYTGRGPQKPELSFLGPEAQRHLRELRDKPQEWLLAVTRA